MSFFKQFGGSVTAELKERYQQSPQWRDGSFQNLVETELSMPLHKIPGLIYKQLFQQKDTVPESPLPIEAFDATAFLREQEEPQIIWYGHSVVMMRVSGKTILIDPMLGPDTTPIAPKSTKRFSEGTLDLIDAFPEIDLVLLTHDHYDHLDLASITRLKPKVKQYITSLGLKRHLTAWGVEESSISEMDWWQEVSFGDIQITFTPTRHFSGRGLRDRMKCLWGGWLLETGKEKIWFSGDGGYGDHFKEIGKRKGPFDLAFMECGQYNDDWHPIHLFPEECVQAALDAGVKKAMPVHWGGFPLSYQHTWKEPVEEFVQFAKRDGLDYLLPKLGQQFGLSANMKDHWWDEV